MYLFQPEPAPGEPPLSLRELPALLASRFPSVLLVFAALRELLAHDIGHAPFGHGGEEALNRTLVGLVEPSGWLDNWDGSVTSIPSAVRDQILSTRVPVYGFDHCVQGVEQVSRVCEEYSPAYPGLNLTFDVRDGVLKHIYDRAPDRAESKLAFFSSLENIVRFPECAEFGRNFGSLEAQSVWFADKVGYLLGDMEDSLRSHLVSYKQLSETELVRLLDEDYRSRRGAGPISIESHSDFLAFQRRALAVLILDCVEASSTRLGEVAPRSVDDVFEHDQRLIDVSERLRKAWDAHYKAFSCERIFRHADVRACCFKAKTIVNQLFAAYSQDSDLVPEAFRQRTEHAYAGILGGQEVRVMCVRNYIAGMTDSYATAQHKRLYMSSEPAGPL